MKKLFVLAALVIAGSMATARAAPVTMDFAGLPNPPGGGVNSYGPIVEEDGFRLTTGNVFGGFGAYGSGSFYAGMTMLFSNQNGGVTTLTQIDGNPFSLLSITLAFRTVSFGQTGSVTFTGQTAGGQVTQTLSLTNMGFSLPVQTFAFSPAFTGLTSVSWLQANEGHQFSGIVVDGAATAVPAPAALALFGFGLAGLGLAVRRRRG